ncbi:MAG: TetR/AcrR family transcriptional regulator [Gemmatimonadota bacterium]|nr:MAG: TetR/AcrR family transcriptional regulator [Gemmatimonadota bacterium]
MTTPTRATAKARRFFEAAEPLFERFGFRKTTVEDVCRAAAMSKRTFYDLFDDKQDLLLQWLESTINERTEEWEESLPGDLDPLGKLHSFLDLYAAIVREHPALKVLVEDIELMRTFGRHTEAIRLSQMGGPLDRILRDGMAAGQFRRLDPRAAMWVVFGILDSAYLLMPRVMNAPGPLEDPVLAAEMKQFIVRGLGAIEDS